MITLSDYLRHHGDAPDYVHQNALDLLSRVNALLLLLPFDEARKPRVTSGWRPADYNKTVPNAAPNSKHITGQAVDIADPDGVLDEYLLDNPELLAKHGLFAEHPSATKSWAHLQSVAPRSGRRHFYP